MIDRNACVAGVFTLGLLCSPVWAEQHMVEPRHEALRQEMRGADHIEPKHKESRQEMGGSPPPSREEQEVQDDASRVQFKIQIDTSDTQNAEPIRSVVEKQNEERKKQLMRNWGG